jgi:alpha-beta hydrolase superfamily lysophospholipase
MDAEASATVGAVISGLRPIASVSPGRVSGCQLAYLDYYGIEAGTADCQFGTFESGGMKLAAQFYRPLQSDRGTVIVVHGYLDHAGCARHLINRLVTEGYNVAAYDHPGHGLSEGRRVSTENFAIYEAAFSKFVSVVRSTLPGPYDVVAHSMGGTAVIDHLQTHKSSGLRRVVLISPLIQDATPKHLKRFGHVISPLINYMPRIPENSSSDLGLAKSIKADPLQSRFVSTHWSRSFARWQRLSRIKKPQPSVRSPLVFNAGIETVIDGKTSDRWMRRTFPDGQFRMIDGGRHQLLNEAEPMREQVLGMICDELQR